MNGQLWWYVARATGLVAWALLALSTALGVVVTARGASVRRPAWFVDFHRGLSGLACLFVAGHLVAILADSFANLGVLDLLVPMRSSLSPGALAWGIVALYLLVAVEATSLAQRRLPYRFWRRVHYLGLSIFLLSTIHGLLVGTDADNRALLATGTLTTLACVWLILRRFAAAGLVPRRSCSGDGAR